MCSEISAFRRLDWYSPVLPLLFPPAPILFHCSWAVLILITNSNSSITAWRLREHYFVFCLLKEPLTRVQKKKKQPACAKMWPAFAALTSTVKIYAALLLLNRGLWNGYGYVQLSHSEWLGSSDEEKCKVGHCHSWNRCFAGSSSELCLPCHTDSPSGFIHWQLLWEQEGCHWGQTPAASCIFLRETGKVDCWHLDYSGGKSSSTG